MLHGGPGVGDHLVYRTPGRPFEALGAYAQIVLVDLRGMGRSDPSDPERWNLERWATDLHELFDVAGIERPVILGESGGGFVALELAKRFPEDVGGLILSSTSARWSIERMGLAFERRGGAEARDAAVAFWSGPTEENNIGWQTVCRPLYAPPTGWVMQDVPPLVSEAPPDLVPDPPRSPVNVALFLHFLQNEMTRFDHRDTLGDGGIRTLVFAGVHDPICPVEDSDELVARIPADKVTYIRSDVSGHSVAGGEPDRFVRETAAFLRVLSAEAGSSAAS
jgi:proline iminopeptidase